MTHLALGYDGEVERTTPTGAFPTSGTLQSSLLVTGTQSIKMRGLLMSGEHANDNQLVLLSPAKDTGIRSEGL